MKKNIAFWYCAAGSGKDSFISLSEKQLNQKRAALGAGKL